MLLPESAHLSHITAGTPHLTSYTSNLSPHTLLLTTHNFPHIPSCPSHFAPCSSHLHLTYLSPFSSKLTPPQAALLLFSPPLPREACCVLRRYFILKNKDKRDAQTLPLALLFFSIILHHEACCVLHHHIKATSTLSTTPPSPFQPRQAQIESKRFIAQESLYTATSDGACLLQSVTTLHQFHHHLPY